MKKVSLIQALFLSSKIHFIPLNYVYRKTYCNTFSTIINLILFTKDTEFMK